MQQVPAMLNNTLTVRMITLLLILATISAYPQSATLSPAKIGFPFPSFRLKNVEYYCKSDVTMNDFKGKWLVLDFWTSYCTSCIESFPKTNELQNEFTGKVQFLLIGRKDSLVKKIYERFRAAYHLNLPIAYDKNLFNGLDIQAVPYVVVINDSGIVVSITTELTRDNLADLVSGKKTLTRTAFTRHQLDSFYKAYDNNAPLLVNGNGGNDTSFLFRSLFTRFNTNIPQYASQYFNTTGNKLQVTGMPVTWLYQMAYGDTLENLPFKEQNSYGKYWKDIEFPRKDSSSFSPDFITGNGLYNYSLIVPLERSGKMEMQQIMQRDLFNFFGYKVIVQSRKMPCWEIILEDSSKIQYHKKIITRPEGVGFSGNLHDLIAQIWYYHQSELPIINSTPLDENVIINLDVIMTDLEAIKKALKEIGIGMIAGKKDMKVIVLEK